VSQRFEETSGRRVVLTVYLGVLGVTGLLGLVLGVAKPVELDPVLFGVLPLPPTALGMVTYGVVTVGVGLGAILLVMNHVAKRFDEERAPE
jgi:membrane-bound ClpP family serine protease